MIEKETREKVIRNEFQGYALWLLLFSFLC